MNTPQRLLSLLYTILCIFAANDVYAADDNKDPYKDTLFGHWNGTRDSLSAAGIDVTIAYQADVLSNVSGGIKRGNNYLDNLDLKFALDGEKLYGIQGNKALIYFLNNDGGHPNLHRIGSAQGIDSIEVVKDTPKLYEAWVDQSFVDNKLSILLGLHDLNTEFDSTDSTNNFIKPSFQIGPEFAQSGPNGPSSFPVTALAARLKYAPTETSYVETAAFDGVAGDPRHPYGNHFKFNEGLLLAVEAGYTPKTAEPSDPNPDKFALGAWMYTKKFNDLVEVDRMGKPVKSRSGGVYGLASYQLYHDKEAARSISAFFRPGIADGNTKPIEWAYEAGLVSNGLVPARPDAEIGMGITQSHNSSKYVRSVIASGSRVEHNEYGLELYYRDKLYKGITVQPDLQYVINPGTNPQLDNAAIIGIRFEINF